MPLTREKLNEDLAILSANKIKALEGFHQIIGAISILEQMIERLNEDAIQQDALARKKEKEVMDSLAEQENGQVNE